MHLGLIDVALCVMSGPEPHDPDADSDPPPHEVSLRRSRSDRFGRRRASRPRPPQFARPSCMAFVALLHGRRRLASQWRGRGVGSALMAAAIDWAQHATAHKVVLQVWPHNEAARALYEKCGFVVEGRLRR